MFRNHILAACLALAFGFACDGKSSARDVNYCGTGSATLTKQVPLTVGTAAPDLEVGSAWIGHSSESYTTYLYGAIKVTNKGAVGHCFVKADSISYRDKTGQEVKNNDFSFVYGRVKVLSVVSTATCLDPGESAYFNLIEKLSYFDVDSLNVVALSYEEGGKPPLANLEATGYTKTGSSISIDVNNAGTGSAKSALLSVYALNASGEFEFWSYGTFANREIWGPGEKRTATTALMYEAPCAKLLAVPYFDAAEVSSTLADEEFLANAHGTEAADALIAARLRQAQEQARAKLALLRR
jgi:hypothetical protein